MDIMPGQKLGPYEIIDKIGRGGMATVYRAHQPLFNREVAIKVLPVALAEDEQFVIRFRREAQIIAKLEHIHVLPVYDFGQSGDILYTVMRYIKTGTLEGYVKRLGHLSPAETARILSQLASALDHAHQRGIVHRDIKPPNIFVDSDKNVLLGDFGIAHTADVANKLTGSQVIGTPAYISPEQGRGEKGIDGRADIYSLGIICYEMLTGEIPYEATTPIGMVLHHLRTPLPDPSERVSGLPPSIFEVLKVATAKERDERYATALEFARAFRDAVEGRALPYASQTSLPVDQQKTMPEIVPEQTRKRVPQPDKTIPHRQEAPVTVARRPERVPVPEVIETPPPPTREKRRWVWPVVMVVGLLALLVGGGVLALNTEGGQAFLGQLQEMLASPTPAQVPRPTVELLEIDEAEVSLEFDGSEVDLRVISRSPLGIAYTTLTIDDTLIAVEQNSTPDSPDQVVIFTWEPPEPGEYELAFNAVDATGEISESAVVRYIISPPPVTETPTPTRTTPPTDTDVPTDSPTPTFTPTATDVPQRTDTPTATATRRTVTNTPSSGEREVEGTFRASSTNVSAGSSVTLSWDLTANQAFVFSVVLVELNVSSGSPIQTTVATNVTSIRDSVVVHPGENTTYRLDIFYNDKNENAVIQQMFVNVTVN